MKDSYDDSYYDDRHEETNYGAETILRIVRDIFPSFDSAIDVGCGVGTWLATLKRMGISEIRGVEGPWVDEDHFVVPRENIVEYDLRNADTIPCSRTFDLAICLEVAEHLPPERAADLVDNLTDLSDCVLFSAAIPYQARSRHLNEQWPSYWVQLFNQHDYNVVDLIRGRIWQDEKIPVWYRQNILLFVENSRMSCLSVDSPDERTAPIDLVHPDKYLKHLERARSVAGAWKIFRRAVEKGIRTAISAMIRRIRSSD